MWQNKYNKLRIIKNLISITYGPDYGSLGSVFNFNPNTSVSSSILATTISLSRVIMRVIKMESSASEETGQRSTYSIKKGEEK